MIMKYLMLTFFSIFHLCYSASYSAQSSNIDYFEVSFKTQKTLTQLQKVLNSTKNADLVNLYRNLETSSRQLFKILDDVIKTKKIDNDYLISLQNNYGALEKALNNLDNFGLLKKTLISVNLDYSNKYNSISFGISPNFVDKIKVVVETKNGSGYFVFVKYSYDFKNYIKRYQFNNATNNAEKLLAPGYYIIWIEKGDYISEDRAVDIVNSEGSASTIYFEIE
jgi:hypothetical protein